MGRRSQKAERTAQILLGFERCIAEHGLAGATLERIAAHAGVGRPALRHHVGNRDSLIALALERIAARHRAAYGDIAAALPADDRTRAMLTYLFGGSFSRPSEEDVVLDELFAVRHREPVVADLLARTYRELAHTIAAVLQGDAPHASAASCRSVAHQLMSLAFGHASFVALGIGSRRGREVRAAADKLVAQLSPNRTGRARSGPSRPPPR